MSNSQQNRQKIWSQGDQAEEATPKKKSYNFGGYIVKLGLVSLSFILILGHLFLPKNSQRFMDLDLEYNHSKNVCVKQARQDIMYDIIESDIDDANQVLKRLKQKIAPYKKEIVSHNKIADLRDQELEASKFGNYTNFRSFSFIFGISLLFFALSVSNILKSYRINSKDKQEKLSSFTFLILAIFLLIRIVLPQDWSTWIYILVFITSYLFLFCLTYFYVKNQINLKDKLKSSVTALFRIKHEHLIPIASKVKDKEVDTISIEDRLNDFDLFFEKSLKDINDK